MKDWGPKNRRKEKRHGGISGYLNVRGGVGAGGWVGGGYLRTVVFLKKSLLTVSVLSGMETAPEPL